MLLAASLLAGPFVTRSEYGVPMISAPSEREAFRALGRATAEDRLWQMELSRRTFRGELAEIRGASAVASDTETLRTSYTDKELQTQIQKLSPEGRLAFNSYAEGINQAIAVMERTDSLPAGYAEFGFKPKPWTALDSASIAVGMARRFGGGGAGEIRNYLAYQYLKAGNRAAGLIMDILDDMLWQNAPESIPTVDPADDPLGKAPAYLQPVSRAVSEGHLALLPKATVPELIPGVRLANLEQQTKLAETLAVVYKTGSYAIVAHKNRSVTGENLLLSGPQMGHTMPSVVYEARIDCPTLRVQGITVPGVPQVVVGNTPSFAWGLTTGVADTTDIFVNLTRDGKYESDSAWLDFGRETRTIRVKGEADRTVERLTTKFGPVVVQSPTGPAAYSLRASYAGQELRGFDEMLAMQRLSGVRAALRHAEKIPLGFNLFLADRQDIGYAFCGLMPRRSPLVDPRFPTPGHSIFDWQGLTPLPKLVQVLNPKNGLLVNWNNKPVSWFPNLDTPAWGEIFRNELLVRALPSGRLAIADMVQAVRTIAQQEDETQLKFLSMFRREASAGTATEAALNAVEPTLREGSSGDATYRRLVDRLREKLFVPTTGNFLQPDFFRMAVQPSVIWRAIRGRTKANYLGDRTPKAILKETLADIEKLPPIAGVPLPRLNYGLGANNPTLSNRGTFIQVVSQGREWLGQSVLGPGNASQGPHSQDQVPLIREWMFKPQRPWTP